MELDHRRPAGRPVRAVAVAVAFALSGCGEEDPLGPVPDGDLFVEVAVDDGPFAACQAELPVDVTVTDASGGPVADVAVTFAVLEGGGSVFVGTTVTDAEGRVGDVWTIGSAPGEANTLAVRTVDAGGGARTHFTRTLRTRSEILFGRPDGLKRLLGDGTLEDVAAGQFSSPAWSPDGTRIAFYRQVDVDGNRVARIYTMNADGTGTPECVSCAAAITPVTQEYSPLWSPDGSQILFARGTAPVEIWIMDASGSGARRLTTGEHPTWSPDGTEIAFRQHTVSTSAIHVMNSDGTGVFRLSNYMEPESYPTWSPDGEEIVFSRSGAGLVLVKREAGTLQRTLGVSGLPVAWSVDGEKVLIRGLDHDGRPLLATVDVGTSAIDELWIAPDVSPQQLTIGNQSWRGCMP